MDFITCILVSALMLLGTWTLGMFLRKWLLGLEARIAQREEEKKTRLRNLQSYVGNMSGRKAWER